MGSICNCYNKQNWKIIREGICKINKRPIYEIIVGHKPHA